MAGAFVGAVAAVGRTVSLEPGASQELGLIIGTASCLPDTSYVVPPGRYEVVAPVWFNQGGTPPTVRPHLVARGARITVEAPRSRLHPADKQLTRPGPPSTGSTAALAA
ncbi:MAG: hypothetical protein M0T79_10575 [Actinomycetota bacterium]|nr:hypothetical protein [Actinomycetota bacterium]